MWNRGNHSYLTVLAVLNALKNPAGGVCPARPAGGGGHTHLTAAVVGSTLHSLLLSNQLKVNWGRGAQTKLQAEAGFLLSTQWPGKQAELTHFPPRRLYFLPKMKRTAACVW